MRAVKLKESHSLADAVGRRLNEVGTFLLRALAYVGCALAPPARRFLGPPTYWLGRHLAPLAKLWLHLLDYLLFRLGIRDPRFTRGLSYSLTAHLLIIILTGIPALLEGFGCITPYRIPGGKPPKAIQVQRVRIQKRHKVIVNPLSEVAFNLPKVEDMQDGLDQLTMNARSGQGEGGTGFGGSGWGQIRFIRLEYNGDWDQDMREQAGTNLLREFTRLTGIPAAMREESHRIALLKKYPKHQSPPFVYMTGDRGFSLSESEVKDLREYILERGGMIFGDCGGPHGFHHSFLHWMAQVVPGGRWVVIPRDDPIYQWPFLLAGSPPLWHHGGNDTLGIKREGRWVVFYHPGDIGDAWKEGHGGTSRESWEAAYCLGANVICYAVQQYQRFIGQSKLP